MKRFLIIADDFTGANDSGVQLTRRGINTHVIFDPVMINNTKDSYVLDTETRGMASNDAYNKVKSLVSNIDMDSFDCVVKKVDSTLRGNIPYEVKAVDEIYNPDHLLFVPAFPEIGRLTKDGRHYLNDLPLIDTEFARDPVKPLKTDRLNELMQEAYPECVHSSIDDTHASLNFNGRLTSFDCASDRDFIQIISMVSRHLVKKPLWIGSAGICNALLNYECTELPGAGLITSVSAITSAQVKFAEAKGVKVVKVPVHTLLKRSDHKYAETAADFIHQGYDTLLISSATYDRGDLPLCLEEGKKYGYDKNKLSELTQEIMSELMEVVLSKATVSGVFLSGGDTAIGFLKRMQASGSDILGEVSNGIPIMRINGGGLDGLKVITKAGGFGNEDAIVYSLRKLKEKD